MSGAIYGALLASLVVLATGCAAEVSMGDELRVASAAEWKVTRGQLDAAVGGERGISVSAPTFRAVVPASDGNAAELRFVDRGASLQAARLASGVMRRQVG